MPSDFSRCARLAELSHLAGILNAAKEEKRAIDFNRLIAVKQRIDILSDRASLVEGVLSGNMVRARTVERDAIATAVFRWLRLTCVYDFHLSSVGRFSQLHQSLVHFQSI